jgi:hypothetical protein
MTIDILYFRDCPNYEPAVRAIREALQQEHLAADINHVEVRDQAMAEALGFPGSPTVRIDGVDVEPAARTARSFDMCCRTYAGPAARNGAPSIDLIRHALREFGVNTRQGS